MNHQEYDFCPIGYRGTMGESGWYSKATNRQTGPPWTNESVTIGVHQLSCWTVTNWTGCWFDMCFSWDDGLVHQCFSRVETTNKWTMISRWTMVQVSIVIVKELTTIKYPSKYQSLVSCPILVDDTPIQSMMVDIAVLKLPYDILTSSIL